MGMFLNRKDCSERRKKSESKIVIRREKKEEYREVENLTREAFWNVYRPGCMEHYVLHCYRDDPAFVHELDLVMEKDGELIGQVVYARRSSVMTGEHCRS